MMRAGVSYRDWTCMTRWQVMGFLADSYKRTEDRVKAAKQGGLAGMLAAVVRRILGA